MEIGNSDEFGAIRRNVEITYFDGGSFLIVTKIFDGYNYTVCRVCNVSTVGQYKVRSDFRQPFDIQVADSKSVFSFFGIRFPA